MREVWDRELRNAIFHSDYSLHGGEVRFKKDGRYTAYSDEQILTLVNRALAYFNALRILRSAHIGSYTGPKEIIVHPQMAGPPGERAIVRARSGYKPSFLQNSWSNE